ncbi:MAG: hypothetical protein V2B19_29615 [Pseudomonadota bacterium]
MSSISTLNIVVQQGNSAHDLQQARQQSPDHAQLAASQQQADKEVEQRSTVQHSEEMENNQLTQDGAGKSRYLLRQKKKKKVMAAEKDSGSTGRLLDTVA